MPSEDRESLCASCGLHPGTVKWVGDGGAMNLIHGFYEMRCKGCVLRVQIENAEERAAALPGLREELAAWQANPGGSS